MGERDGWEILRGELRFQKERGVDIQLTYGVVSVAPVRLKFPTTSDPVTFRDDEEAASALAGFRWGVEWAQSEGAKLIDLEERRAHLKKTIADRKAEVEAAVAAERERCAVVAETIDQWHTPDDPYNPARAIAAKIREVRREHL